MDEKEYSYESMKYLFNNKQELIKLGRRVNIEDKALLEFCMGNWEEFKSIHNREPSIEEFKEFNNEQVETMKNMLSEKKKEKIDINTFKNNSKLQGNPYTFILSLLKQRELVMIQHNHHIFGKKNSEILGIMHQRLSNNIRLFNLDTNLINLLIMTNNQFNLVGRRLPFPSIFINKGIKIGNLIIHGILLSEVCSEDETVGKDTFVEIGEVKKPNNLLIGCMGYDYDDNTDFFQMIYLKEQRHIGNVHIDDLNIERDIRDLIKNEDKLRLVACNLIDFLNNPEIEIVEVIKTDSQNKKRICRGKLPIPPTNHVRITGELKIYLDELKSGGHFNYTHKFWVRGHFRTLRNEQRYKDKVGMRMWILPYIKGKGILINKEYEVIKKSGENRNDQI